MKPIQKTHQITASDIGIDLVTKTENQLFCWFLACILFGKPIQQPIAAAAYKRIIGAGITSVNKLLDVTWDELVELLDEAHYVRYDYSTATKLIDIAHNLKRRYGTVSRMMRQAGSTHDLENILLSFRGIGPVTAEIFIRETAPIWFPEGESNDYDAAKAATELLAANGYDAYAVGGAVRDLLLNRRPTDFDLATNATPEQIMGIREFEKSHYKDTAQAYGVTRVKFTHAGREYEIEIATFRRDIGAHHGRTATTISFSNLEQDVQRRDFTINALALDVSTGQIIDYVGGIDDIEAKQIRFIGDPRRRIHEDPLRIMRAIRFKNHLGFEYHPSTAVAISSAVHRGYADRIATDRMRDELTKLLTHPTRKQAIEELDDFGILKRVLPEVTAGKGVAQPPEFHAEGDVWQHQLLTLDNLPSQPSTQLAWAALLHDIGKAPTVSLPRSTNDRIHFNRHYAVGAELAKTILRRLHFSNALTSSIAWMIYNHLAIDDLPVMRPSHRQRLLGHPAFEDLLELHRADAAASWRAHRSHNHKPAFKSIERLWHEYQRQTPPQRQPSLKRDLGIDGNWLQANFGRRLGNNPGPIIGSVLTELDNWYRDEGIRDVDKYMQKTEDLLESLNRHDKSADKR